VREGRPRSAQSGARGVSSPSQNSESTTMGCSGSFGEGEPLATSTCGLACGARGGPLLQAARPTELIVIVQTRYRRNRWWGRGAARKRSYDNGGLRRSTFRRACSAGERASMGLAWLAARSSRKRWASARRALRKGRTGSEGERAGCTDPKRRAMHSRRARIGRSRNVLARRCRKVVCRSR